MKNIALIVAGGEGTRMGSSLPKQFLKVQERPLMMLTLEAFMLSNTPSLIYLIMHGDHMDRWADECRQWNFKVPHNLVPGGKTRTESVYLGLKALEKDYGQDHYPDWIAVHDAVRPLLSPDLIDRGFTMAKLRGNSIPSIPLKDSIRKIENEKSLAVDRNQFRLIQTPQIFPGLELFNAYKASLKKDFSDDASLFESFGKEIYLMEGEQENIKITYPLDLVLADFILTERKKKGAFNR